MFRPIPIQDERASAARGTAPRPAWRPARAHGRGLRAGLIALAAVFAAFPAGALDEVILSNGRRYLGTIVSDTPQSIILSIDGGTVEFPRSAVVSPPYLGRTETSPVLEAESEIDEPAAPHPVPGVSAALGRLREFPWAGEIRQVPVLVSDRGRWQQLPCVAFWAGDFFQLSFFGDPKRPAVVELSLPRPPPDAWQHKQQLLEFAYALVPGLATDSRFDRLELKGDSFAVGDLWFAVTSPESGETPGRWTLVLMHEMSIAPSRASGAELLAVSEPVDVAMLDPTQPRTWQKGSWTPAELAWLRDSAKAPPPAGSTAPAAARSPMSNERVFVRSFARVRGSYVRNGADWLRPASAAP